MHITLVVCRQFPRQQLARLVVEIKRGRRVEAAALWADNTVLVDACQRELRKTGWLAYKGRKTAAHFLVFDLWMDWRIGAFHDEEVLLDYDFAMNYGNWAVVYAIAQANLFG